MKIFKNILRWWLSLASIFGFLGGWIMLAHAPKPVSASQSVANNSAIKLPALEPLPPLGSVNDSNAETQFFAPQDQQRSQMPIFVTGGS